MWDRFIAYLDSIHARDPAPRSRWEILIYPGVWAVGLHRVAHWLFDAEMYFLARLVNHISRWLTAIDIHPGAKIGRNLFIDHGFTVIGETAEIGDNVIVGSGAQILGPVVIGERARIGAGAVVTEDVPEGATMVGLKARSTLVPAETYVREFIPYGTPCEEPCEPTAQRIDELEARLAMFHAELEKMRPEGEALPESEPAPARSRKLSGSHS